jgi:hypothetical protein
VSAGKDTSVPFLMSRSAPPCSHTKSRPSGAKVIAVGLSRPSARSERENPEGSAEAEVPPDAAAERPVIAASKRGVMAS